MLTLSYATLQLENSKHSLHLPSPIPKILTLIARLWVLGLIPLVVSIMDVVGDDPIMEDYYFAYPERVQVYNSSNDSWREINNATVPFIPNPHPCFGMLFKGAFHWTGLICDGRFQSIFAFDFKNEVF